MQHGARRAALPDPLPHRRRPDRCRGPRLPGRRQLELGAARADGVATEQRGGAAGPRLLHERRELLPDRPGAGVRAEGVRRDRGFPLRDRHLAQRAGLARHVVQRTRRRARYLAPGGVRRHGARRPAVGEDPRRERRHLQRCPGRRQVVLGLRAGPRRERTPGGTRCRHDTPWVARGRRRHRRRRPRVRVGLRRGRPHAARAGPCHRGRGRGRRRHRRARPSRRRRPCRCRRDPRLRRRAAHRGRRSPCLRHRGEHRRRIGHRARLLDRPRVPARPLRRARVRHGRGPRHRRARLGVRRRRGDRGDPGGDHGRRQTGDVTGRRPEARRRGRDLGLRPFARLRGHGPGGGRQAHGLRGRAQHRDRSGPHGVNVPDGAGALRRRAAFGVRCEVPGARGWTHAA
ncbi:hypothetical protein CURTO8I2_140104 [Curtobacterium sp. 8I-2]|nr:hypothetical protein CURTO8I2_140104 [Curtobacterium sp. 8I-2]